MNYLPHEGNWDNLYKETWLQCKDQSNACEHNLTSTFERFLTPMVNVFELLVSKLNMRVLVKQSSIHGR